MSWKSVEHQAFANSILIDHVAEHELDAVVSLIGLSEGALSHMHKFRNKTSLTPIVGV